MSQIDNNLLDKHTKWFFQNSSPILEKVGRFIAEKS